MSLNDFFRKAGNLIEKAGECKEKNIVEVVKDGKTNQEKFESLSDKEKNTYNNKIKKSKFYCVLIFVLLLPITAASVLFTLEAFTNNFMFIILAILVWVILSSLLGKAKSWKPKEVYDSKGVKVVFLTKLANIFCIIAGLLGILIPLILLLSGLAR